MFSNYLNFLKIVVAVANVAELLLPPEEVLGFDDQVAGCLSTACLARPRLCPRCSLFDAGMVAVGWISTSVGRRCQHPRPAGGHYAAEHGFRPPEVHGTVRPSTAFEGTGNNAISWNSTHEIFNILLYEIIIIIIFILIFYYIFHIYILLYYFIYYIYYMKFQYFIKFY